MDNGLNRLLYYRGMYWLVLGGKKGLYKVADHFPCTQSGPGDRRKNICVISPADHRHVFTASILRSGCRHHISLWDRIWGGTQVLTYWVMSYRLHKHPFKTFSALNNDLCLSIIQDSFCSWLNDSSWWFPLIHTYLCCVYLGVWFSSHVCC